MLITSHHPEKWDLQSRGVDRQTGFEMCHVRRIKLVGDQTLATVWRLVKYPNGWHNVGQFLPGFNGFRPAPERRGVKLSGSRTDLTLLSFADHGHGNAYA